MERCHNNRIGLRVYWGFSCDMKLNDWLVVFCVGCSGKEMNDPVPILWKDVGMVMWELMVLCYHCHLVCVLCRPLHSFDFYEIIFI